MTPHPIAATPSAKTKSSRAATAKRRGSYNCGRCGLPKKGHICPGGGGGGGGGAARLRRSLSFDEDRSSSAAETAAQAEDENSLLDESTPMFPLLMLAEEGEKKIEVEPPEVEVGGGGFLPASCMVEVLRRLSPKELMAAATVCRGWRECIRIVWRSAIELRLRVSPLSQIGFVGSVLQRCAGLARLTLIMESDLDSTTLACVAFSCPNLEVFEINVVNDAVNRITGEELGRFVSEKRCLTVLKVEGCVNLGFLYLNSSSLSTLWLSDLYCISKSAIKCPNLKEISLNFIRQDNDTTDLVTMLESIGHSCLLLEIMHVVSLQLCNEAVLAFTSGNPKSLRMLSILFGSKITDAAVTAIVSTFSSLELLDLSGSSITDSGIRMICNAFPETLTRLLLAHCSNITSNGIQLATAQLPLLQLIDCGMSIRDTSFQYQSSTGAISGSNQRTVGYMWENLLAKKKDFCHQKLIIKHGRLRKMSLWGCSGFDALYLNCPELDHLNLNSCTSLHPERLLLQCPNLKNVHVCGCQDMLIGAIRNQVLNEFSTIENHLQSKRLADGSKRIQVPRFLQQSSQEDKRNRTIPAQCFVHHD